MNIIFPTIPYSKAVEKAQIGTLLQRRFDISKKFFMYMQNSDHILNHLLQQPRETKYDFRIKTTYPLSKCKTSRFKNTLIPYGLFNFQ